MVRLPPVPPHLPYWQAGHIAWLNSEGIPTRYGVAPGERPVREEYHQLGDLTSSNLAGADLSMANFKRCDLNNVDMSDADLTGVDFTGANLTGCDLSGSDLTGAKLSGANLTWVNIAHAEGITSVGPIGRDGRIIYIVAHVGGPMVHDHKWWGTLDEFVARIEVDYDDDHAERDRYIAAVRAVAALVT